MNKFYSSILGLASLSFIFIGVLDGRLNVTKSVIDGSFVQKIERVRPYVGIDGTVYVRESVDKDRLAGRNAHRRHCYLGASFQGFTPADCGTLEAR